MQLNKIMLAATLAFGVTTAAQASSGDVTFSGDINDSPCSVTPGSLDLKVDFGSISQAALAGGKKTQPRPIEIELEHCDISIPNTVKTTFHGVESDVDTGLLTLGEPGRGAAIALLDQNGADLPLGTPSNDHSLISGTNTLRYQAQLRGHTTAPIVVGSFHSVARFVLDYQ